MHCRWAGFYFGLLEKRQPGDVGPLCNELISRRTAELGAVSRMQKRQKSQYYQLGSVVFHTPVLIRDANSWWSLLQLAYEGTVHFEHRAPRCSCFRVSSFG